MSELIRGVRKDIKSVLEDDSVSIIIDTEPVLTRVERKNAKQIKEYIKDIVEALKEQNWVKAIVISLINDCTWEEVVVNIVPTYVGYMGKLSDEELSRLYNSTLEKLRNVTRSVYKKYYPIDMKPLRIYLADEKLEGDIDFKSFIVYEKECDRE